MELEGVEPSSSRGTGAVSTCVVSGWFLCGGRPGRPTAALASKDFAGVQRRGPGYFRFNCTALSIRLGKRTIGRCLVPATVAGIKLIYCASIRQRERSCFRHLNWSMSILKSFGIIALHACAPLLHAVKAGQPRSSDLQKTKVVLFGGNKQAKAII